VTRIEKNGRCEGLRSIPQSGTPRFTAHHAGQQQFGAAQALCIPSKLDTVTPRCVRGDGLGGECRSRCAIREIGNQQVGST
jgi:hypothetical protein